MTPHATRGAPPARSGPARRRSGRARLVPAAAAGLLTLLVLGASTGLLLGNPAGAGDNGDGARLWCGAGLVPHTPDGTSAWKGGVVLDFTTGAPACADPLPSSALAVLRAVTPAGPGTWSLTSLGWAYLVIAVAAAAVAGWAASARGPWRAALLAVPVLPLTEPAFSRFLISTFSEPAGLVGLFVLLTGVVTAAVTHRADRAERVVALLLVAAGGVFAATAKTGFVPVLAVAVLVCLLIPVGAPGRRARVPGVLVAVALAAVTVGPVLDAAQWQARHYSTVNTVDIVFTTVLPEIGHDAIGPLGLPAGAAAQSGQAWFPRADGSLPGNAAVAADPTAVRNAAWAELATTPGALLRSAGVAVQATEGRGIGYLPSTPWTPTTPPQALGHAAGAVGSDTATLRVWLDSMAVPWWPSAVLLTGVLAAVAGLGGPLRRRFPAAATTARVAGLCAATSVALALTAVLGDGYFEIAKHVWPAAYLVDATVLALASTAVALAVDVRRRRDPAAGAGVGAG
ncbi:hypothetical protein [Pseudonocardia sp.]|uniref:glycan biosynthesis hexose transferase WsfD n=1 Tax=Pseudonocardia sp. TaxID=60912 RepID=UPI003D0A0DE9